MLLLDFGWDFPFVSTCMDNFWGKTESEFVSQRCSFFSHKKNELAHKAHYFNIIDANLVLLYERCEKGNRKIMFRLEFLSSTESRKRICCIFHDLTIIETKITPQL